MSFELVGPFKRWDVVVDGWKVPLLEAEPENGGIIHLRLDGRFGLDVPVSMAEQVMWFLANAIAVAAGYPCHPMEGEDRPDVVPHVRPVRTSSIELLTGG